MRDGWRVGEGGGGGGEEWSIQEEQVEIALILINSCCFLLRNTISKIASSKDLLTS